MGKGRKRRKYASRKKRGLVPPAFSRAVGRNLAMPSPFPPGDETAKTRITIEQPGEPAFQVMATDVEVHIERDYVDATTFGDVDKTYLVQKPTWTIKARG